MPDNIFTAAFQFARVANGEIEQLTICLEDCGERTACDLAGAKLAAVYAFMTMKLGMSGPEARQAIRERLDYYPDMKR